MSAEEETVKPVKAAEEETSRPAAAAAAADEQTQLTEQDIAEIDARPFFFRHVTAVVKFCAIFLTAGQKKLIVLRAVLQLPTRLCLHEAS